MTTLALILLVTAVIVSRVLRRRSLPLLTVEQKASMMDATASGDIWPLVALIVVIIVPWYFAFLHIPPDYRVGAVAAFLFAVLLLSLGASATRLVRLSRLALPRPYLRSIGYGTLLVHFALLLLIVAFAQYASHRFHP
jgi:uncharacterized membrane protein